MRDQIYLLLQPSDDPHWFENLLSMGSEKILPILSEIVMSQETPDPVRGRAVIALGHLRDTRATAVLIDALHSDNAVLRAWTVTALGRINEASPVIVEQLVERLTDADGYVRRSSAEALGKLGSVGALPDLEAMAKNDSNEVNRQIAASAIEKIKENA